METCAICQSGFQKKVNVDCGHEYCFSCIKSWVKMNNQCPLCKKPTTKFFRNGVFLGPIEEPKRSFALEMDNHVHGDQRRPRVSWNQQLDLPGFVVENLSSEDLESFSEFDESEVPPVQLKKKDSAPISSRLRRRVK